MLGSVSIVTWPTSYQSTIQVVVRTKDVRQHSWFEILSVWRLLLYPSIGEPSQTQIYLDQCPLEGRQRQRFNEVMAER